MERACPSLSRKNYRWWARTYGSRPRDDSVRDQTDERGEGALFDAIRANRVAEIERRIADAPAIAITKVRESIPRARVQQPTRS